MFGLTLPSLVLLTSSPQIKIKPMMSAACIVKITLLLLIHNHQTLGGLCCLAPLPVCVLFSDHELCDVRRTSVLGWAKEK